MTNIATVLRMDPTVAEHIDEIICMGGGIHVHNRSYRSETNFYNDPEAAKIMLNCGVKVTVVTLDATHSSWFGYEEVNELRRIGTKEAEFAAQQERRRRARSTTCWPYARPSTRRFSPTCAMSPATWTSGAISRTVR